MQQEQDQQSCFVIMPISDVEPYEVGHFGRVYEYIIKPACKMAGFKPIRADEVQITNYIVVDILRKILEAPIAVCDLSSRNPNVMYELGIRQAFNLPVTIIRDSRTPRIFDIQGLRDIEYDESLRIDKINVSVESLANVLKNTSKLNEGEVNSIIQLLGVRPATMSSVEVSTDTSLLLNAISDLGGRLSRIEEITRQIQLPRKSPVAVPLPSVKTRRRRVGDRDGIPIEVGTIVLNPDFGEGQVVNISDDSVVARFGDNLVRFNADAGIVESLKMSDES